MRQIRRMTLAMWCCALMLGPAIAWGGNATLYRDTYGVPHIYADTAAAAAYALGYAQAEDRLEDLYQNVRTAIGAMAEFFGPEHVETDYILRVVRNAEVCRDKWPEVSAPVREICEAFIAGINAYIAEHPERVPEYALPLEPWHCIAIGRAMILQWPLGTLRSEYNRRPETPAFGSNCWAVSPARSADGSAILLTDPHLRWESLAVFYECRVFGGELAMAGFCLLGTPVVALGHNAHVGWACTTGGPDTSDVYMLKLNPDAPTQYEWEGAWEYMKMRLIRIPVKGEDAPRVMPAMDTRHGPLIAEPDTKNHVACAGKTPYAEDIGLLGQMYDMLHAKDTREFFRALAQNSFMEQNIMFAGRDGIIGYARVGKTPIRPDGYDWTRPVPGHTRATEWLGLHPIEDLVHVFDPAQGWMQCCNTSPQLLTDDGPVQARDYKPYIFNATWDQDNPRGKRARQLLAADDAVTKEKAIAITMDVYDLLAKPWQQALKTAMAGAGALALEDAEVADAARLILEWHGEFTQDSAAAALVRMLRLKAQGKVNTDAIADGAALGEDDQRTLVALLRECLDEQQRLYGKTGVLWGEIHQVGRGDQWYPCDGADFGRGKNATETLRNVESREDPPESGRYRAHSGTMSAMVMFFHKDRVESYTCIPWGQSGDPASPHYMDQGRELYSKRRMKPTWFDKEALMQNLSSEKTLVIP